MKKFRLISLALLLCLIPCTALFACALKQDYLITASTSDTVLGSVEGVDNKTEMLEGTKVTLKAKAKGSGIFVCWVKDNSVIVEGETNEGFNTLDLVYGKDTAGSYTAVFRDGDDYSSTLYAKLTGIKLDGISTGEIKVNITVSRLDIEDEGFSQETIIPSTLSADITNNRVFYFGKLGQNINYGLQGNVVVTANGEEISYRITFGENLTKNTDFSADGVATISGIFNQDKNIELTFQKL